MFYVHRTRTDFRQKNRSENRFVCADFCSDIKSLRSFLRVVYDKKSVRVRWLQSEKKSEWLHPTMGPRLLLSHTIALIKNGPCALTFGPRKNRSDFFSELLATKKSVVCADSVREKCEPSLRLFSELLTTKNRSVCAGHYQETHEFGLLVAGWGPDKAHTRAMIRYYKHVIFEIIVWGYNMY